MAYRATAVATLHGVRDTNLSHSTIIMDGDTKDQHYGYLIGMVMYKIRATGETPILSNGWSIEFYVEVVS